MGILILEVEGDALELARIIAQGCSQSLGRAVAVLTKVPSMFDPVRESAMRVGQELIAEGETFCFRLHKRGAHGLEQDTPKIEYEVGGAIWEALQQKHGKTRALISKIPM
jgi:tRNA(Ser,Leu) C12 N-acetylase TAN1